MADFKVGDKVILRDSAAGWSCRRYNVEYVVKDIPEGDISWAMDRGRIPLAVVQQWHEDFELVEQVKPKFVARKFRVRNSKHSRQIQETLFSLGYKWAVHGQKVQYVSETALFSDTHGHISWGDAARFERSDYQEAVMVARTSYSIEDVPQKPKSETVELNGLTYLKTDLEAALKKLTPVGGGK